MALKPHVLERQMNLVALLMKSKNGLHWGNVAKMDGYAEGKLEKTRQKRFERDLASLADAGLVIVKTVGLGLASVYKIDRSACLLPKLNLTPEQRMTAYQFGLAYMDGGAGPLAKPLASALMKLQTGGGRNGLPGYLPKAFIKHTLSRRPNESGQLDTIGTALLEHRHIEFKYQNQQEQVSTRTVAPWSLVSRGGGWYLIGFDKRKRANRVFKLSRFKGAVKYANAGSKGSEYEIPDSYDQEAEFSSEAFRSGGGVYRDVKVSFDKQVAFIVANEFEGTYEIKNYKNGSLDLHLPQVWPVELMRLLGEFPGHWKIRKPKALATHIEEQLKATLDQYKKHRSVHDKNKAPHE